MNKGTFFMVLFLCFASATPGQNFSKKLIKTTKNATVLVKTQKGFGTAFCINKLGLFLTNFHVVGNDRVVKLIMHSGEQSQKLIRAKVVKKNKQKDLALLSAIDKINFSNLELGSINSLYETMEVMALGFPFGNLLSSKKNTYPSISINLGHITSLRKTNGTIDRVQLDIMLNPGNSGGPIVDRNGKVVGVVAFGMPGTGINFAIPVNDLKAFVYKSTSNIPTNRSKKRSQSKAKPKKSLKTTFFNVRKNDWILNQGQLKTNKKLLYLHNNGDVYWITSKKRLPGNFQVDIPFQIAYLQGLQRSTSQDTLARLLCVRFGTSDSKKRIVDSNGYVLWFSHKHIFLKKGKKVVAQESVGNSTSPMVLSIIKKNNLFTVAVNSYIILKYRDNAPFYSRYRLSIGGYLSKLLLAKISVSTANVRSNRNKRLKRLKSAEEYCDRGISFYNKGKYNQAEKDYTNAIKLDSKYVRAYINRGILYYKRIKYNQAEQDYTKAIELYPKYANLYYNRAALYYKRGKYKKAILDWKKAILLNHPKKETLKRNINAVKRRLKRQRE